MKIKKTETNREAIGLRIRKLRKERSYSQAFVAKDLSITQAAYSRIENSNNGIVVDHIIRLSGLYEVTTDFILKGNKRLVEMSTKNGFMPYVSVKAHAGFVKNFDSKINFEDQDWFKIPGYNPSLDQKLFEVEGDSMIPTIFPRDVLICQVQPNINNILSGSLLLVVTNDAVLAKRFQRIEKGALVLTNDNPEESEENKVKTKDIKQTLIICGKISGVLVPHHQVVSEGKMNSLQESIEMLKKEMFTLHKKVQTLRKS